jgi:hypothetical protein
VPIVYTMSVHISPDGECRWHVYTGEMGDKLGVPGDGTHGHIRIDPGDRSDEAYRDYVALSLAALGSRLLRLANQIADQRALFPVVLP